MVRIEPVQREWAEALAAGDDVFSERFVVRVEAGWSQFPETIPFLLEATRGGMIDAWGPHLFFDDDGALVGNGGWKGAPSNGTAELGYSVAPARQGRGIATAAVRELVGRARVSGLRTVVAHTLARESASTTVLSRCGFTKVGDSVDPEDGPVWRWELHVDPRPLSRPELEAAHCWETSDHVPGQPEMTEFRRRLRYHQARWREVHGHPIGSQPTAPRPGDEKVRPVGSRLPLAYGRESGANLITAPAREAAQARTSFVEPHQSFDHQRLWADLLSCEALAFNLFGELAADVGLADEAVHAWWPDVPGQVVEVRFAHSPGRLDPAYLGNLVAFDAAFVLDLGDGSQGVIGVVAGYHGVNRRQPPKPTRLPRYRQVMDQSEAFGPAALQAVNGTELIHFWLDHLLMFSMLQHPRETWRWGRFVVVHPAGNTDFAGACSRYRNVLADQSSFSSVTVEALLEAGALPAATTAALRDRYLPD